MSSRPNSESRIAFFRSPKFQISRATNRAAPVFEKSSYPCASLEASRHGPVAYTQPLVRSLWANIGQMAGLFFHDLTRIPAGGGFKRRLGGGRIRVGLRGGAGILREGPILMGRDK